MSGYQQPPLSPYFMANAWNMADHQSLKQELQKAIVQDPEIMSKADISVDLVTDGTNVSEVHLIGSVSSSGEKERAGEIVSVNTRNQVRVVNELVIK